MISRGTGGRITDREEADDAIFVLPCLFFPLLFCSGADTEGITFNRMKREALFIAALAMMETEKQTKQLEKVQRKEIEPDKGYYNNRVK